MMLVVCTVLLAITLCEGASLHEYSPQGLNASDVRDERHSPITNSSDTILQKVNEIGDDLKRMEGAVKELEGYFKALGVPFNVPADRRYEPRNPCAPGKNSGVEGNDLGGWTLLDNSTCVKFISGMATYANATDLCRQEFRRGQDIAVPGVVSQQSAERLSFEKLIGEQMEVVRLWVVDALIPQRCLKLTADGLNITETDCDELNSVFCEKPLLISYTEVVERQLGQIAQLETDNQLLWEANRKLEKMDKELEERVRRLEKSLEGQLRATNGTFAN